MPRRPWRVPSIGSTAHVEGGTGANANVLAVVQRFWAFSPLNVTTVPVDGGEAVTRYVYGCITRFFSHCADGACVVLQLQSADGFHARLGRRGCCS